jgi:hypothetical protein
MKLEKVVFALSAGLILPFSMFAQKTKTVTVNNPNDYVFFVTKCKATLKQTATGFTFGGIDFNSKGPMQKIGSVSLDPKLLQSMNAQAQILDQFQLTTCQQLNSIPISDPKRTTIVAVQGLSVYQLSQLAYLAQMYSSNADALKDALLKWVLQSGDLIQQILRKQFLSADPSQQTQKENADKAVKFALDELKVTPGSAEAQRDLADPLKSIVQPKN